MHPVDVIEDPAAATVALDPLRARILAELRTPASAAALAGRVGQSRQKLNYHLHALEAHGLVRVTEERHHGGITERLMQATAQAYVVAPDALGAGAPDPATIRDRLSAHYLVALAARVVGEVGRLARRADETGGRLPTLAVDAEIGFASAAGQAAFARELTEAVNGLVARHHHDDGVAHRLLVAVHPTPDPTEEP